MKLSEMLGTFSPKIGCANLSLNIKGLLHIDAVAQANQFALLQGRSSGSTVSVPGPTEAAFTLRRSFDGSDHEHVTSDL